jgi:chromosome segregation ATPase
MDEDLRAALTAIENRLARIESRVDAIPVLLPSLRDRLNILDAQMRQQSAILSRLEDTISMDVLERIRKLETEPRR